MFAKNYAHIAYCNLYNCADIVQVLQVIQRAKIKCNKNTPRPLDKIMMVLTFNLIQSLHYLIFYLIEFK